MKYLSKLTPAEILVLTKENVTQQELLKITFIDLLLKQVLKVVEIERPKKREIQVYKYVRTGAQFDSYKSLNHERLFLWTFANDKTIEILFRNLVKISYQKSKTLNELKNDIIKAPVLKDCFSQNILQRIFYGHSLTGYGNELKRKINVEIQNASNDLVDVDSIDNQKAIELIKQIGANIFILINVDYELLQQIDNYYGVEISKNNSTDTGSGCSGCGWNFNDYSSNFDSSCSGDSGCGSGCSGCGGD